MKKLQTRGPSAGAPGQGGDGLGPQRPLIDLAEQFLDLPRAEPEVVRADLADRTGRSHSWHVDLRYATRPEDQLQRRWTQGDKTFQCPLRRSAGDLVEIVEDE